MDGDVHVTTCETAWSRREHTVHAQSEIGATVTVTADHVDSDCVAKLHCYNQHRPPPPLGNPVPLLSGEKLLERKCIVQLHARALCIDITNTDPPGIRILYSRAMQMFMLRYCFLPLTCRACGDYGTNPASFWL